MLSFNMQPDNFAQELRKKMHALDVNIRSFRHAMSGSTTASCTVVSQIFAEVQKHYPPDTAMQPAHKSAAMLTNSDRQLEA